MRKSRILILSAFSMVSVCVGFFFAQVQKTENVSLNANAAAVADVLPQNIFVELSKKTVPSVVNISTLSRVKQPRFQGPGGPGGGPQDEMMRRFWERFFRGIPGAPDDRGHEGEDAGPPRMSLGTGFIIDEKGLILTNNHVVSGADEIKVQFTEDDDQQADGEVVGRDSELDLAVIKVKTTRKLVPLSLGDSDQLQVGEYVMAVGNPIGHGHSVTHGIISAKDREVPDFPFSRYLQTDAPINPGNSGGPLLNLKGEVIGINNAIDARAQGIGFAIPSSAIKKVLPQLISNGKVARGYIGILVQPLTPEIAKKIGAPENTKSPYVAHVFPGEPAAKAGVEPYDILLELNGKKIGSASELIQGVTAVPVGEAVKLKLLRDGKTKEVSVKVAQRPSKETLAQQSPKEEQPFPKGKKGAKPPVETGMILQALTPALAKEMGLPARSKGVVVTDLAYGSSADRAGIARGDVILEVDRKPITSVDDFFKIVKAKGSYLLRVQRLDPSGRSVYQVIVLDLAS